MVTFINSATDAYVWYQDEPYISSHVCQILTQSDYTLEFYGSNCKCAKIRRKNEETLQVFTSLYLGNG